MSTFDPLLKYLNNYISLTNTEEERLIKSLELKKYKKRQFFAQPGFVCLYQGYVTKGCLRAYMIDKNGVEHTIQFAIEDWWISDFASFITQTPATFYVEAIEEAEIITIKHSEMESLYNDIPKLERCFRIITQRAFMFSQKRILSGLSQTAEERYLEFIEKYPQIEQRVPQYAVASYLGFSPEFLSKIRKRIASTR